MDQKNLGNTTVVLPEVGLGTWRFNGEPEVMLKSLELGGFLIDTAESYGTEVKVGQAISGRRHEYFLATKVSPHNLHYDDVINAANNSLHRLGTDWIDLYQVHWPNHAIPIVDTMKAMADLVKAGKVRHVGVSNFSVQQFREAQEALGDIQLVCNQVQYNLFSRSIENGFLPYSSANRITVMAYSPLAQGRIDQELGRRPKLARAVNEVARVNQMTHAQVLLAWCLYHPQVITIPQTNTVTRIQENIAASGKRITEEQYSALSGAN